MKYCILPARWVCTQVKLFLKIDIGQAMAKITLHITDMHCSNCAMRIESLEDELPGVQGIIAGYQKNCAVVEYDDSKIGSETIIRAIENLGYTLLL